MNSSPEVKVVARLDGILVPPTLPFLRADDLGVLHGDGVFETTLVVDGNPRDLPEHLARLQQSARALDLAIPASNEWGQCIDAAVAGWAEDSPMVLRLIATRGVEGDDSSTCYAVGSAPSPVAIQQRSGITVLVLKRGYSGESAPPYLLTSAKTLSTAVAQAALRHARSRGADDVIFVGADGRLLEGATSTLVVARGRTLVTPPRSGILDGITARRLFAAARSAGWTARFDPITPDDLTSADGVYLVSSVRLLAPVVEVDGREQLHDADLTAELAALLDVPATDAPAVTA